MKRHNNDTNAHKPDNRNSEYTNQMVKMRERKTSLSIQNKQKNRLN